MRRYYRLAAPGAAFAAIGVLLLVLAPLPSFTLVGGLVTSGCYALAVQIVLTMLLLAAIEDLQQPLDGHGGAGGTASTGTGSNLRGALLDFYRRHPLPAALLGFGLATSVTAVFVGALGGVPQMAPTAVVVALLLVLSSVVQVPAVGRGFFGWTAGAALGGFLALQRFDRVASFAPLLIASIVLLALLWVLGGIAYAVRKGKRGAAPAAQESKRHAAASSP